MARALKENWTPFLTLWLWVMLYEGFPLSGVMMSFAIIFWDLLMRRNEK